MSENTAQEITETTLSTERHAYLKRVEAALIRVCKGDMTHEELARWKNIYRIVTLWLIMASGALVAPAFAGDFHATWTAHPPPQATHQTWEPGGHFSLAAASAFGVTLLCERTWVFINRYASSYQPESAWADRHVWLVRLACGSLAIAGVAVVATIEHHHDDGFNHDDAVADWTGAVTGAAAAGATGLLTIHY